MSFTYVAAPTVTSVNPTAGSDRRGHVRNYNGTNLGTIATAVVDFGPGQPATIVSDTGTKIVATSPAGTAGTVNITVTTFGGTSAIPRPISSPTSPRRTPRRRLAATAGSEANLLNLDGIKRHDQLQHLSRHRQRRRKCYGHRHRHRHLLHQHRSESRDHLFL